jgi:hypothetical protein
VSQERGNHLARHHLKLRAGTPGNQPIEHSAREERIEAEAHDWAKCRAKAMVIVELKQPNYNATIEAIGQAVTASLRPGAATDKLLAVAVEMSTKLTTHIEDFEQLANDVLLAVWDRLEAATSREDAARLINLTLEDVRQIVAACRAAITARHISRGPCLIDEDQLCGGAARPRACATSARSCSEARRVFFLM